MSLSALDPSVFPSLTPLAADDACHQQQDGLRPQSTHQYHYHYLRDDTTCMNGCSTCMYVHTFHTSSCPCTHLYVMEAIERVFSTQDPQQSQDPQYHRVSVEWRRPSPPAPLSALPCCALRVLLQYIHTVQTELTSNFARAWSLQNCQCFFPGPHQWVESVCDRRLTCRHRCVRVYEYVVYGQELATHHGRTTSFCPHLAAVSCR